jgi:hypothetical protein
MAYAAPPIATGVAIAADVVRTGSVFPESGPKGLPPFCDPGDEVGMDGVFGELESPMV